MPRRTVSIAAIAVAAFIPAEPASGQTRHFATACAYEAVLEHVRSTAPEHWLVLFRWVSLHERCAADYRACRQPQERHLQSLIDRLQDAGLISATFGMDNDSLVWQDPRPGRPAAVNLGPLVPVEDFPVTSYRYFLSQGDDGSCEVVYRMVTGMV